MNDFEKPSKAWETYDWSEGQVMTRGKNELVVIDADGVMQAIFKPGTTLRVCVEWHDDGKPRGFRDATDIYAKFPKWVRLELTRLLSGAVR